MPRRGFTLVELLVVIGVITVLSAIAIPAIGFAQRKAREAKCRTMIAQVQAGLESFRTSVGTYPEGPSARGNTGALTSVTSTDASTSWTGVFGPSNNTKRVDEVTEQGWQQVNSDLLKLLVMVAGDNFRMDPANPYLHDPFSVGGVPMVLRYRPARFFRFDSTAAYAVDQDDPPGRDSYQLWSCGRDGLDQFGSRNGDDVTSWEKR
jgi:prepilin-type N-terminal cleavage/methylation domain-containing protein